MSEAANGSEAVERMRTSALDLVFLDWQMPVMGGAETCRAMRAISDVPIIVVSALDRTKDALVAGALGSVTKPVDVDVLLGCIDLAARH